MTMLFYAQLNDASVCVGISALKHEVQDEKLVPIVEFDTDYLWRKYDGGEWSDEKYEPSSTAPLDEFEQMKQRVTATEDAILALLFPPM